MVRNCTCIVFARVMQYIVIVHTLRIKFNKLLLRGERMKAREISHFIYPSIHSPYRLSCPGKPGAYPKSRLYGLVGQSCSKTMGINLKFLRPLIWAFILPASAKPEFILQVAR